MERFDVAGKGTGADDFDHDPNHYRAPNRDDDARDVGGRGPTDSRESHEDRHDSGDDSRWPERDRGYDAREVFTRNLYLPRGPEREIARVRDREYTLRGSETRTLATVGAFRVVSSRDLRDQHDRPLDPRSSDLRHLREQRLVETVRLPGSREHVVALTKDGRRLLEHHRNRDRNQSDGQTFWHGAKRERELAHDVQVYRAYERAAARLESRGAMVDRVVLDHELKRGYQQWLHQRDRDRADYDGHPDRSEEEIREWAREHGLPYFDEQVHFPDLRIEYRDRDGEERHQDVEVVTEHYRGVHGASVARSGFSCYRGSSLRIGGGSSRGGGVGHRGGLAAEMLGTVRWLFEMTLGYAKMREQFGRPIGSFQAIQHKLANMALAKERALSAVYYAAMTIDAGDSVDRDERRRAVHVAKAAAGAASRLNLKDGIQIHGGIGYTWEHDLHLFMRRALVSEQLLGTAGWHHDRLGELLVAGASLA